jgi:hypothetical protein
MDKVTWFLRSILKGYISINDVPVKILPTYTLVDSTPCITINNQGGGRYNDGDKLLNMNLPLPSTHPLYDTTNPNKLYPQQVRRNKNYTTVVINTWASTEQERYQLNEQVTNQLWKLESDYYTLCSNYTNGICNTTNTPCPVTTKNNSRTIKGQCPNTETYNYISPFMKYNIIRSSFKVEPEFNQDEYDSKETIFRSIYKISLDYYNYHVLGGNPTTGLNIIEQGI